jgi:oxygen-independent coproporphyrinogen-3 oxidase
VCPYCDFVVYAGSAARGPSNRIGAFVDAVVAEIGLRAAPTSTALRSVYLGGGTPSLMSAAQVARVLDAANRAFGITADAEITLEVNPGATEHGDLGGFRACGVNRVSIGAQSFDDAELKRLGRRHTAADIRATAASARAAGFDNLCLDLLYDVPEQTIDSWRATLSGTLALEPEHVSAYALDLSGGSDGESDHLPVSRGAKQWRSRAARQQDDDRAASMYEMADDAFAAAGMTWYEISNWSLPGRHSRHNMTYWTGAAWEAVGPGAHAFDGRQTRRWNGANLDAYVSALTVGQLPPGSESVSDDAEAYAERLILALRTSIGVPTSSRDPALEWAHAIGLVESDGAAFRLTRRGRLLSNELFTRLLPDAPALAA